MTTRRTRPTGRTTAPNRLMLPALAAGVVLAAGGAFLLLRPAAPVPPQQPPTTAQPAPPAPVQAAPQAQPAPPAPVASVPAPPAAVATPAAPSATLAPVVEADGSVALTVELEKPQYVTVVIEDAAGTRVRNLVSETLLPAGKNRLVWDGYDDGTTKDGDLTQQRVAAGTYRARGLVHDQIRTIYEFTAYGGGNPAWQTKDETGAWMADHSSPLGAVFIPEGSPYGEGKPQILLCSLVAECGRSTVWVGLDGKTYQRRAMWGWDGGQSVAVDLGKTPDPRFYAYILVCMGGDRVGLRALARAGTPGRPAPDIAWYTSKVKMPREPREIGLTVAVRDGLAAASVPLDDAVVFFDVRKGKVLGTAEVKAHKGVLFDDQGRLLVSTDGTVKRFTLTRKTADAAPTLGAGQVLIRGLEDPRTIATDPQHKELYVADWGNSHQIKVYSPDGKAARVIGRPGGRQLGLYDDQRMIRPQGLAIDSNGQLWVAEAEWIPKRVSLWNAAKGTFNRAIYGPPHYGGGGTIDAKDPSRLFYAEYGGTMEFKLDWKAGTSTLVAIPIRNDLQGFDPPAGEMGFGPEVPWHVNGRTYLTLGYQSNLRHNATCAIWLYDDKTRTARPVAHVGSMRRWEHVRTAPWIKELQAEGGIYEPFLSWHDFNADGKVTRDEFKTHKFAETITRGGKTTPLFGFRDWIPQPDLSMCGAWNLHIPAPTIREDGTPIYDISKATFQLPPTAERAWNEDGYTGQRLPGGLWLSGFGAYRDGKQVWSYPATWEHGLIQQYPGHMVEPTRLMGPPFTPKAGEATDVLCWNAERGGMYLLTGDGLFIQTLGGHRATNPHFDFPEATRGLDVSGRSFDDEHFHPTITCTKDGIVYMVAGKEHSSIFRLDGFETVRRRSFGEITLGAEAVAKLAPTRLTPGRKQGRLNGMIEARSAAPTVDGNLEEWGADGWLPIASAGSGRLAVSGDRLYAAWKTSDPAVVTNTASDPEFAFKRGGCVDLLLGPANRKTGTPMDGDLRLLACQVKGATVAVLYRQVARAGRIDGKPVLFESPIGKVQFEDVRIVTDQVRLAVSGGNVELSVPTALLALDLSPGQTVIGDLGILRGNGVQTVQRSYWNNLDTAMVSDIPTEARLAPGRWGNLKVGPAAAPKSPANQGKP